MTKNMTLRLPAEQAAELEAFARVEGIPVSEAVRTAVAEHIERRRQDAKFQALVGRHEPTATWLVLPQGYMNASGRPVQMLAGFFKIPASAIVVAHDELDFPPGTIRLKQGGGVAGHNGLRDISTRLGTHDYWRLRIGIGHPGARDLVTHYLLNAHPSRDERATIDAAIDRALEVMPLMMAGDFQTAMLKLHTDKTKAGADDAAARRAASGAPTDPADTK